MYYRAGHVYDLDVGHFLLAKRNVDLAEVEVQLLLELDLDSGDVLLADDIVGDDGRSQQKNLLELDV